MRAVSARTTGAALGRFYAEHHEPGTSLLGLLVRRPVDTVLAVVAVLRLPVRHARLGDTAESCAIAGVLRSPGVAALPMSTTGVAVLDVPAVASCYAQGRDRQTLRRRARAARRGGAVVRLVEDPAERRALLAVANDFERAHPDVRYRGDDPSHAELFRCSLWMAAFDGRDAPVALAAVPVDGEWAALSYLRALGSGTLYSDSRYLLSQELVQHLSTLGVRHLVETYNPAHLTDGLRQFQMLLGYHLVRVRVSRERAGARDPASEPQLRRSGSAEPSTVHPSNR